MICRYATLDDSPALAEMNRQLIRDEGHRNAMNLEQLTARMAGWLRDEYLAVVFEDDAKSPIGYALYRLDPEWIYLRQMYVVPGQRRKGVGRDALHWMWRHAWPDAARLRVDVLLGNTAGLAFWRSVGFEDYCVTMEAGRPPE